MSKPTPYLYLVLWRCFSKLFFLSQWGNFGRVWVIPSDTGRNCPIRLHHSHQIMYAPRSLLWPWAILLTDHATSSDNLTTNLDTVESWLRFLHSWFCHNGLSHIQITHHRSTCLSVHAATPTRTLRLTNHFFLYVPCFTTEFGKRSFSYLAPTVWSGLPLNTRLSPHLQTPSENSPFHIAHVHINYAHIVTASASDSVSVLKCLLYKRIYDNVQ